MEIPLTPAAIIIRDMSRYLATFTHHDLALLRNLLTASTPEKWKEWMEDVRENWGTQGVQYRVYFRGMAVTLPHPQADDHVYTLDEVCGVIREAGFGLRGRDGEWLCEPEA